MKNLFLYILLLILLTLSCKSGFDKNKNYIYDEVFDIQLGLDKLIIEEFEKSKNPKRLMLNLNELTIFKWDKLYFIQSYTPNEEIKKMLKLTHNSKLNTAVEMQDSINCIVFSYKNEIIKIMDLRTPYSTYILNNGISSKNKKMKWVKVPNSIYTYYIIML